MGATPQYGQMIFRGVSGKTYPVDLYVSDVNGGLLRFDGGAGAGTTSPDFITFSENVILEDYSMTTGTADTEKIRLLVNSRPTGHILRYVPHVSTNSQRPRLSIGFKANARISAMQISD